MSMQRFVRWLCGAAVLFAALGGVSARADTPIALFQSFAGNINFVGTQKTMRTQSNNGDPCAVVSSTTTLTAALSGIPSSATVLSAQLYWATSTGGTGDFSVTFQGATVSAPSSRQYASSTIGSGFNYTAGGADVTTQVRTTRNGNYTFSGLNVTTGSPYCASQAVVGGFALVVIYSDPAETFRVLNLYEGLQYIQYNSVTLNLSNFKIPTPIGSATGRVGHITWEGDATLSGGGEDLLFNGVEMIDATNPTGNQFNSASNINNDLNSYGIDFDAYVVSSPTIQSGQTTATTVYRSGQDLVLMNAEIIAVPNVPVADLAIGMTLDDPLSIGQAKATSYTITVSNNGPSTESGPIVVNDTLPSGMTVGAVGGSGWVCSVSGQSVSCSYTGALAVGATLPALVLHVSVTPASNSAIVNTASVSGQMFDNINANNSVTVSTSILVPQYVLTDAVCTNNVAFGASQPCHIVSLNPGTPAPARTANVPVTGLYITNLNTSGLPTRLSSTQATALTMSFAIACRNPSTNAGVRATWAAPTSVQLPLCMSSGATPTSWSSATTFSFPTGSPSVSVASSFNYADVGSVELFMKDGNGLVASSGAFVLKPGSVALVVPGNQAHSPALATDARFVRASEAFTMSAQAWTGGATPVLAANFGHESVPVLISVAQGVAQTLAADGVTLRDLENMVNLPLLNGGFGSFTGGSATASTFSFDDVGILKLTPSVSDYLGGGAVTGSVVNVGRFVPDHFDTVTDTASALMTCAPEFTACTALNGALRMAYAGQSVTVTVTAKTMNGATAFNYSGVKLSGGVGNGVFAKAVTLSAWGAAGSAATANPPAAPSGSVLGGSALAASGFSSGVASTSVTYTFPVMYSSNTPQAAWVLPTLVYLRATDTDAVTSLRSSGSVEGGFGVVSGRLALANGYGSDLLKMPLDMRAQYFVSVANTSIWKTNASDSVTALAPGTATFSNCKVKPATSTLCNAGVLVLKPSLQMTFDNLGTFLPASRWYLGKPGAGNGGSVDFTISSPAWLPSTKARATFGVYSNPLIYVRELY